MDEQEYQDKLKVRGQLSQADRLRVLEHEFEQLQQMIKAIQIRLSDPPDQSAPRVDRLSQLELQLSTLQFDNAQLVNQIDSFDKRIKELEQNMPRLIPANTPITAGDSSVLPAPQVGGIRTEPAQ